MALNLQSLESVLVDGKDEGPLVPAVLRLKLDATEVQSLLYNWRDDLLRSHAEELADKAGLQKNVDELKATLVEHQQISDDLVTRASTAITAGDGEKLKEILEEAATYGKSREIKRKEAEVQTLKDQVAQKETELEELKADAEPVIEP